MSNVSLSRELVNQALEALEKTMNVWGGTCAWHSDVKHAITNLRAALAQEPVASASPEELGYVPLSDDGRSVFIDGIGEVPLKLEPAQDPVAWLAPRTVDSYSRPDLGYETCSKTDYGAFAVYTAPPQRKPLPLKDVERLIYENTKINPNVADDKELLGYIVNAIRAVERAHNIVE